MAEEQVMEGQTGEAEGGEGKQIDPAVIARARENGWAPKDQWRGDPARWMDADVFVETGEKLLPFLKKDRDRFAAEAQALKQETATLKAALAEQAEAINALREFNGEAQKTAIKQALKDLREQKAQYQEEGNWKSANLVEEQIEELKEKLPGAAPAAKKEVQAPAPAPAAVDPVFQQWQADNAGWLADRTKRDFANGIAAVVQGQNPGLTGRPFLDKITAEVEKYFGGPPPVAKSDGASLAPNRGGKDRSFAALPADAKKACDDLERKLVGPGKAYKDQAAWRKQYLANYDWE